MNLLLKRFKEVSLSVLPITLIVTILNFTLVPIDADMLIRFIIGAVFVIIGLALFLFGADTGIGPIGQLMGETIAKTNKSYLVGILGFILGFLITIAEPDLQILANQVNSETGGIDQNIAGTATSATNYLTVRTNSKTAYFVLVDVPHLKNTHNATETETLAYTMMIGAPINPNGSGSGTLLVMTQ